MSDTERAWAAGFFDGEGSTVYSPPYALMVTIVQADTVTLERFITALGVEAKIQSRSLTNASPLSKKPLWVVRYYNKKAVAALEAMWPYLSQPKIDQAQKALDGFNNRAGRRLNSEGRFTLCKRGHELSGDNVYTAPDGGRECRTCILARRNRTA